MGPDAVTTLQLRGVRIKDAWQKAGGTVLLRVMLPEGVTAEGTVLRYGDRMRAWAQCTRPRNFRNPGSQDRIGLLARRGIFLLARARSPRLIEVLPQDSGTPWGRAVASVRRSLRDQLARLQREGSTQSCAILSSIVLGDYVDLSSTTKTEFQNAGTYHALVVSGLHVSWIAWVLALCLRMIRVPLLTGRMLTACGILFFTGLVGFQASITRALWMFTLYLAGQSIFRKANPVNIVFACAFLLLAAHPAWLLDAGFQLSFLSVTAIVLMGLPFIEGVLRPLTDPPRHAGHSDRLFLQLGRPQALGRKMRVQSELFAEACADRLNPRLAWFILWVSRSLAGIGFALGSMIAISIAVQIWLEPVLAFYFDRLSWIAPLANLAVVPLSSLVLAAGMIAEAVTALIPSAWPVFHIARDSASLLLAVNRWFSTFPGAWQRCPIPCGLSVTVGILLILIWRLLRWRRSWIPCILIASEIACLSLAESRVIPQSCTTYLPPAYGIPRRISPPLLKISFLDVGQGDSIVIQFPDSRVWVVDAGGLRVDLSRSEEANSFDIGEAVVSRFLWSQWIVSLDRAVLTHGHQDHAGGMPAVLQNFPTNRLDWAVVSGDLALEDLRRTARATGVPVFATGAGETCNIGGVTVRTLNPVPKRRVSAPNDGSIVLHLEYGRFTALLPGDMEGTGEAEMLAHASNLQSMLLKVAHHGSRNATLEPFLDRVRPRWAVISAGWRNPFQNPAQDTILRLLQHGARLLLTMDQGAIFLETDGNSYTLSSYALGCLEKGSLR
jgi:competence protein ComEC